MVKTDFFSFKMNIHILIVIIIMINYYDLMSIFLIRTYFYSVIIMIINCHFNTSRLIMKLSWYQHECVLFLSVL